MSVTSILIWFLFTAKFKVSLDCSSQSTAGSKLQLPAYCLSVYVHTRRPCSRHVAEKALVLTLLLCGDIHPNPGPRNQSIFPCGYCAAHVDFGMKAICCDNCDIWFHKSCASMTSSVYSDLNSEDWYCYRCHTLNCDTFHAYEYAIPTSNSFSALMSDVPDDVSTSLPMSMPPRAHSSPIGSLPAAVAHMPFHSSSIQSSNISTQELPKKGDNWRTLVLNVNSVFTKAAALQH